MKPRRILLLVALLWAATLFAQDKPQAAAEAYKPVLDRLEAISVVPLADWRAHAADLPHGEDPALGTSDWEPVKVRQDWSGSRWLRTTLTVPERINGYGVRGAGLQLDLHATSDQAIQVSVFSNGSLISRTDEDTQLPVTLTNDAQPGQKFEIAVRVLANPVKTSLYWARLLVKAPASRPDPALLRMEVLAAEPLIAAYEDGKAARQELLDAAVKAIDTGALDRGDQAAFDASLRAAQAKLEALGPYERQFTIRCTGNSHIDMAWLWPWTETVEVTRNTFASALQMMREYPDLTFTMASAQTYAWMEEKYPEIFREIQQRVKEGRWEIVGGMWVEPDLNLPDGESLVRQLLIGKRYFREKFGVDVKIGWNPDSFGYNWQLPQIYKRAGIDYFVTQKIYWNDTTKFPYKLFWWEAPDGSRLLTYFPHDYANQIDGPKMASDLAMYAPAMWKADAGAGKAKPGELEMMYLFGVGDHGGGPTRRDLDVAQELERPDVVFPRVKFGTAGQFFDDLGRRTAELNIPTWDDELYFEYHRGVQTTQAEEKRRNRKSEVLMLDAERLASIATLFGRRYPQADLNSAWKDVLFNQFHDILPGSGIAVNYVDAARKYARARRIAGPVIETSLATLGAEVAAPTTSLLVFNPLSWTRTGMVEAEVQFPGRVTGITAIAPDGRTLPAQVLANDVKTNRVRVRLLAEKVPALGYELVRLSPVAPARVTTPLLRATSTSLENEFFRLAVDPQTGCITSLFDKRSGTEALAPADPDVGIPGAAPGNKPCGNLLQVFVDKPKRWDAWNIDADFIQQHTDVMQADEVKLVENGPLQAVIRVRKHFGESQFVQDITMYAGVPRVDVVVQADWHEKHKLLKVAFPLSAHNEKATFEIPYGSIERPTTRRTPAEQAKFEVPALRWADLSDADHGFSLLNDSKYGYDARGNVLRLSLLRAPEWPDPHADEGHHEFTYALYPHGGGWRAAMTVRRGYELNYPLLAVALQAHQGPLPQQQSFFSTGADNVIITAVKKDEDDDSLLVRMYEWAGRKAQVNLQVPPGMVVTAETDEMEKPLRPLAPGEAVAVNPFEIVSLRVERAHERSSNATMTGTKAIRDERPGQQK